MLTIYALSDVAAALDVSRSAVCNWLRRYSDTPPATHVTPEGLRYWNSLDPWVRWRQLNTDNQPTNQPTK